LIDLIDMLNVNKHLPHL